MSSASAYAKRMAFLSARIFGEVARPTRVNNQKIVKIFSSQPLPSNNQFINYYPRHPEINKLFLKLRYHGLYRDEHEDFREEMIRLRELRGKVKPKKGEGRRKVLNK